MVVIADDVGNIAAVVIAVDVSMIAEIVITVDVSSIYFCCCCHLCETYRGRDSLPNIF